MTKLGGHGNLKGFYKFSITTLEWMIRSRKQKIKSIKEEISLMNERIKELKREEKKNGS